MIRHELEGVITSAIARAQGDHQIPPVAVPEVTVERPSVSAHGDYASSISLKMARVARMAPMEIASIIATHMVLPSSVATVEVAPPGFLNVHLSTAWLAAQVDTILGAGSRFGSSSLGVGKRIQVEYVSANPTGPLHVGTGRGAALGDSLARVLSHSGYEVEREYYVNDAGSRMEAFNGSVYARYSQALGVQADLPDDGYPGDYLIDVARQIATVHGRRFLDVPREEALLALGRQGVEILISQVREDLTALNVHFDNWFYEQSLFDDGLVPQALDRLRGRGVVVDREGAVWFASSAVGQERDNVLIRSNGLPTYFASDVAYHYDKLVRRGYDVAIDVWGADHQGHVPRMKAVLSALDVDPERLVVLIYQLVNLVRQGRPVAMGKRTGAFVTLREVLDEVGPDAVRFFLVGRSPDAMMDFDLDLAKAEGDENPVYYVQMAHARIAGIMRRAEDIPYENADVLLLRQEAELALIRKMLAFPEIVEDAALAYAPHPLPHFAQDLAATFHAFYHDCRVISDDEDLTRARLKLVAACKTVLATTLDLIGVSAPEQM